MLTRLHGGDHASLGPPLYALAQIELIAGKLDRARTFIERSLAIHVLAKATPRQTVEHRFVLAQILSRQHHRSEALGLARRAWLLAPDLGTATSR